MKIKYYEDIIVNLIKSAINSSEISFASGVDWEQSQSRTSRTCNIWVTSAGVNLTTNSKRSQNYETRYSFEVKISKVDLRTHASVYDVTERVFSLLSGAQIKDTGTAFFVSGVTPLTWIKDAGYWEQTVNVYLDTMEPTGYCGL